MTLLGDNKSTTHTRSRHFWKRRTPLWCVWQVALNSCCTRPFISFVYRHLEKATYVSYFSFAGTYLGVTGHSKVSACSSNFGCKPKKVLNGSSVRIFKWFTTTRKWTVRLFRVVFRPVVIMIWDNCACITYSIL